jgi:hypothetical protein
MDVRVYWSSAPSQCTEDLAHRRIYRNNAYEMHANVAVGQQHEEPAHRGTEQRVLTRLGQGLTESGQQYLMLPLVGSDSGQCRTQRALVPGAAQVIKGKGCRLLAAAKQL